MQHSPALHYQRRPKARCGFAMVVVFLLLTSCSAAVDSAKQGLAPDSQTTNPGNMSSNENGDPSAGAPNPDLPESKPKFEALPWRWDQGLDGSWKRPLGLSANLLLIEDYSSQRPRSVEVWSRAKNATRIWSIKSKIVVTGILDDAVFLDGEVAIQSEDTATNITSLHFYDLQVANNTAPRQTLQISGRVKSDAKSTLLVSNAEGHHILKKGADGLWAISSSIPLETPNVALYSQIPLVIADDHVFVLLQEANSQRESVVVYRWDGSTWVKDGTLKSPLDEHQLVDRPMGVSAAYVNGTFVIGVGEDDWGSKLPSPEETATPAELFKAKSQYWLKDSGAVYVYRKKESGWALLKRIKAPNAGEGDRFGDVIGFDGTTIAVAATRESSSQTGVFLTSMPQDNNEKELAGAVYLFREHDSDWVHEAYVKAPATSSGGDTYTSSRFGSQLFVSGDTLIASGLYVDFAGGDTNTDGQIGVYTFAQPCKGTGSAADDSDGDGSADDVDCEPCNPEVHPNAGFSHLPLKSGSFDRNCSGAEEKQLTTLGACVASGNQCVQVDGWSGSVPGCGQTGAVLSYCTTNNFGSYVVCGAQYTASNAATQSCR